MTTTGHTADPIREAILAAMDRLLAGTPLRSSGRLSVSQLAIEAGIKRWHLTHQHLDLKELFAARVKTAAADRQAFGQRRSDHDELKDKHAKLIKHCVELEERLQTYASAINLLALENAALTASSTDASVVRLPTPGASP